MLRLPLRIGGVVGGCGEVSERESREGDRKSKLRLSSLIHQRV